MNPAPATVAAIHYALPRDALVELSLHDVAGRLVRTLAAGWQPAGEHAATVGPLPMGVYLYRLRAGGYESSRKLVVW